MEKITNETEVMETAITELQSEFTIGKSTRKPLRVAKYYNADE